MKKAQTVSLTGGAALAAVFTALALAFGLFAVESWLVMLVLGALHHSVTEAVPALGFWPTMLCLLALNFVVALLRGVKS